MPYFCISLSLGNLPQKAVNFSVNFICLELPQVEISCSVIKWMKVKCNFLIFCHESELNLPGFLGTCRLFSVAVRCYCISIFSLFINMPATRLGLKILVFYFAGKFLQFAANETKLTMI